MSSGAVRRGRVVASVGAVSVVAVLCLGIVLTREVHQSRLAVQLAADQAADRSAAEVKADADIQASKAASELAAARADAAQAMEAAAAAKAEASKASAEASAARAFTPPTVHQAAPTAATTSCGTVAGFVVSANAVTSCPFAVTVARGYVVYGNYFTSRSPVTGQWYDMTCTTYPVTCTGGNGAAVFLR